MTKVKKSVKMYVCVLLAFVMVCASALPLYAGGVSEVGIAANDMNEEERENHAYNKPVDASGQETSNFGPEKAVDKDMESRWSGLKEDYQWFMVDLQGVYEVDQIDIYFHKASSKYSVFVSEDKKEWEPVYEVTDGANGYEGLVSIIPEEPVEARYVKYEQYEMWLHTNNQRYGSTFYEFEVYGTKLKDIEIEYESADDVLRTLGEPEIQDGKLVLPESPSEDYTVSLYGCDNRQIVDMDTLNITEPLEDMTVKVLYHVEHIEDQEDFADSETDIEFAVPGKYAKGAEDNEKPNVVPGLREWKGGTGEFVLNGDSRIVYNDPKLAQTAETIQFYFSEMLGRDIKISTATPVQGDIFLKLDSGDAYEVLGEEGYTIDIDDIVTITSEDTIGVLYGGISITQIMYQGNGKNVLSKGQVRDYPKYKIRAGMIDVGRMYVSLDYLEEMSIYMAWFKMNEVHVHINDYWGNSGYSGFRVESKKYPKINSEDGLYTQEDYRAYQNNVKRFGIDVVTEIDTPYHAEQFREYAPMRATGYMDIHNEGTYTFVEGLIDEFLDGDDAIVQSDKFHIGTDEYYDSSANDREGMRKYTNHFINYVNDKGYETRLWGSLGGGTASRGFRGTTEVSNNAVMNLWAPYWADVKEMYAAGYDIINTCGGWLYIVPGANAGYPDRLVLNSLYDNFDVNNFSPNRSPGVGTAIMPVAHPQTVGASFCIWNDMTSFNGGFTAHDVFDRMRNAVMITSEKTWYGEKTEGQTAEEFTARTDALKERAPGANPGRYVETETSLIAHYEFTTVNRTKAFDTSENEYDAQLVNADIQGRKTEDGEYKGVAFNGTGYMSLPMDSIGFPYTVSFDLYLDEIPADTVIFSGEEGTLVANFEGTGKLAYSRGEIYENGEKTFQYSFIFNYTVPEKQWVSLALTAAPSNASAGNVILYADDKVIGTAAQTTETKPTSIGGSTKSKNYSSTFVLPTERILDGAYGAIDNLVIYNYTMNEKEVLSLMKGFGTVTWTNVALKKDAEASSVYPDSGRTADKAVDGSHDADDRWSSKRIGTGSGSTANQYDPNPLQWLKVDLGDTYYINKILINWEGGYAKTYEIQYSMDGIDYELLQDVSATAAGVRTFENLGDVEARYVKIQCKTAANNAWGYNIIELEVYESFAMDLLREINAAKEILAVYEEAGNIGKELGNLHEDYYNEFVNLLSQLLAIPGEELDEESLITFKSQIKNYIKNIRFNIVTGDEDVITIEELQALYDQCSVFKEEDYKETSWKIFKREFDRAAAVLAKENPTAEEIKHAYYMLDLASSLLIKEQESNIRQLLRIILDEADAAIESGEVANAVQEVQDSFNAAYKTASDLYEGETATNNELLDAMLDLIQELHKLGVQRGNKERLQELYDMLSKLDMEDYEDGSEKDAFIAALTGAENILKEIDAIDKEIEDAYSALLDAAYKLKEKENKVDKTYLNELIKIAKEYDLEQYVYVEQDHTAFTDALKHAQEISDKPDATQEEVNAAAEVLAKAMAKLRYKADKTILQEAVGEALQIDLSEYTPETAAVLKEAVARAQLMLADEMLSEDDEDLIEAMAEEVHKAIAQLVRIGEDTNSSDTGSETESESETSPSDTRQSDPSQSDTSKETESDSSTSGKGGASGKGSAKTGDTAGIVVIAIMMLMSCGVLAAVAKKRSTK